MTFCMKYHFQEALRYFDVYSSKKANTLAVVHLFEVNDKCSNMNKKDFDIYRSIDTKLFFR